MIVARTPLDLDELVEHWTLLKDEQGLVSGKHGATRLGFAVLLKFYTQYGRFPRGRFELPGEAVEFVAGQVPARARTPRTPPSVRSAPSSAPSSCSATSPTPRGADG
ncbi:DUF4158 domain-containing protein [Streptomyces sp. NPDC001212]